MPTTFVEGLPMRIKPSPSMSKLLISPDSNITILVSNDMHILSTSVLGTAFVFCSKIALVALLAVENNLHQRCQSGDIGLDMGISASIG